MENNLEQIDIKLNHLDFNPPDDGAYGYRQQCIEFANIALEYFNKNNHTKYELVEDEDMHSHPINFGTWFHCNFKAKDSSIEEFFAEIYAKISGIESVVTTCQILKDEKHAGCKSCGSHINHSVDGYKMGRRDQSSGKMQEAPCICNPYNLGSSIGQCQIFKDYCEQALRDKNHRDHLLVSPEWKL
ncbi:hypothetical protein P8452_26492 [Trifolium repens]|nr:hypothetical protein QL285_062204 [Trifolium repens]WJX38875.1 hypothetical protein P8452_26492 [Trifolium repens]